MSKSVKSSLENYDLKIFGSTIKKEFPISIGI